MGQSIFLLSLLICSFIIHHYAFQFQHYSLSIKQNSLRRPFLRQHVLKGLNSDFDSDNDMENGVNLYRLSEFSVEGQYLKESIMKWLDNEYIIQPIHLSIGEEVERIYIRERNNGVNDLGGMLMCIGTYLESFEMYERYVMILYQFLIHSLFSIYIHKLSLILNPFSPIYTNMFIKYYNCKYIINI